MPQGSSAVRPTNGLYLLPLYQSNSSPGESHMFPAPKQNPACDKFKDVCEVGTTGTRWLITEDRAFYKQGTENLAPLREKNKLWL